VVALGLARDGRMSEDRIDLAVAEPREQPAAPKDLP